jgi:ABC-type phosphate/phosphonate transport system substrate-binding protein
MTTQAAGTTAAQATSESPPRKTVTVGVLAGAPSTITIWQYIREFFRGAPVELDFVLYSNYVRANAALLDGHIDVVWQGPLTHVQVLRQTGGRCKGLAMRDTDVAFKSYLVTRRDSGIGDVAGLRGKRVAMGSETDSQASIMPLHYLAEAGVSESDLVIVRPAASGGRAVPAEAQALTALFDGRVDAAAISAKTWEDLQKPGGRGDELAVVFETPGYAHCVMTALDTLDDDLAAAFVKRLTEMDWNDPEQRHVMELEWMHRWVPAETADYSVLLGEVEKLAARGTL